MSPGPAESPRNRFESALRLAREGRFADAMASVGHQGFGSGTDGEAAAAALAEVARIAQASGQLETAAAALGRALELRPAHADLHYRRACVLLLLKRGGEAREALDRALEINPRYVAARIERAQGHWDDAAASFGRALELNPAFHDARVGLAAALEALEMRTQAMEQLALVLERDPAHGEACDLHDRWTAAQARPAGETRAKTRK